MIYAQRNPEHKNGSQQKIALLETSLERAAELLGNITAPVMENYYRSYPGARVSFHEHGLGNSVKLEAEMADSVLYCLMNWFDRPEEIRIMFASTVPHHEDTLKISNLWFMGLVNAAIETISTTIPVANENERAVWQEIRAGLEKTVLEARD